MALVWLSASKNYGFCRTLHYIKIKKNKRHLSYQPLGIVDENLKIRQFLWRLLKKYLFLHFLWMSPNRRLNDNEFHSNFINIPYIPSPYYFISKCFIPIKKVFTLNIALQLIKIALNTKIMLIRFLFYIKVIRIKHSIIWHSTLKKSDN